MIDEIQSIIHFSPSDLLVRRLPTRTVCIRIYTGRFTYPYSAPSNRSLLIH